MNLLLDSCTLIWLASEPARLSQAATAAINAPEAVLTNPCTLKECEKLPVHP